MDKSRYAQKLNDFFGDKTIKVFMPKQFLANLSTVLTKQNETLLSQILKNNVSQELLIENKKTQDLLRELKKAIQEKRIEKVEVANFPEYPKFPEIKIPEQKEIKIPEYPKEIEVKKSKWYKRAINIFTKLNLENEITALLSRLKRVPTVAHLEETLDRHKEADNAFAVRLVTYDGKDFYNAMFSGGGGGVPNPLDINMRGYNDTNWQPVGLDEITRSLNYLDHSHHEVHEGDAYTYCEQNTLNADATRDLLIVTPDTGVWGHFLWRIRGSGEASMALYEGTTTSNDGTGVTEVNRNRNSANTSDLVVTHTPTITGVGTVICMQHFGSSQKAGGEERAVNEFILKQNTKYLLRVTSEAASNDLSTEIDWYEHTNKIA